MTIFHLRRLIVNLDSFIMATCNCVLLLSRHTLELEMLRKIDGFWGVLGGFLKGFLKLLGTLGRLLDFSWEGSREAFGRPRVGALLGSPGGFPEGI